MQARPLRGHAAMPGPTRAEGTRVLVAIALLSLLAIPIALVALPLYVLLRVLLRIAVELLVLFGRRRALLIYSDSPVWQPRIEETWLPRFGDRALVLNWTEAHAGGGLSPVQRLLTMWAPPRNVQPVAIVFPGILRTRQLGFYDAFRDWKNGDESALRRAEEELFAIVEGRSPSRS